MHYPTPNLSQVFLATLVQQITLHLDNFTQSIHITLLLLKTVHTFWKSTISDYACGHPRKIVISWHTLVQSGAAFESVFYGKLSLVLIDKRFNPGLFFSEDKP